MKGAWHYSEAERHLSLAARVDLGSNEERYHLGVAAVHAKLAQVAATFDQQLSERAVGYQPWGEAFSSKKHKPPSPDDTDSDDTADPRNNP